MSSGGIIGFILMDGPSTISNCKVVNTTVPLGAGICGTSYGYWNGNGYTTDLMEINNCEVYGNSKDITCRSGIMNCAYYGDCNISNCKVQGISVEESGGMSCFYGNYSNKNTLNISNVTVKDVKILDKKDNYYIYAGAFIINNMDCTKSANISNCTVQDCEISGNNYDIGIIAECARADSISITDCSAKNIICTGTDVKSVAGALNWYWGYNEAKYKVSNFRMTGFETKVPIQKFAGVAHYIGGAKEAIVENCAISNTSVTGKYFYRSNYKWWELAEIAGIVMTSTSGNINISNCTVNGFNVNGKPSRVAGIIQYPDTSDSYTKLIKNCKVNNMKITEDDTTSIGSESSNRDYGGIFGICYHATIENCTVNNFEVDVTKGNVGGIAGTSWGGTINNSKASNIKLKNNYLVGGIAGASYLATYDGCEVSNAQIRSNFDCGGIVGTDCYYLATINNCKVSNSSIESTNNAGGIAGCYQGKIENCEVSKLNLKASNNAGGVIGIALNIANEIKSCKVSDVSIEATSNAGGIAGLTTGNLIQSCKLSNVTLKSTYNAGGIVAINENNGSGNNNAVISGCEINNITLEGTSPCGGIAGCFTGKQIDNCKVTDITLTEKGNYNPCGGIVGVVKYSGSKIEDCEVIGGTIDNTTAQYPSPIGGICGFTFGYVIKGCKVESLTLNVKNNNVGGILASMNNNAEASISDCEVKDVTINNSGTNVSSNTGGIIGFMPAGSLANCKVEGCTINTPAGIVGGISGQSLNTAVSGCEVKTSNIINSYTGTASSTYTGGISGFGTNVQNCNVLNTRIESSTSMGVGGIIAHGQKNSTEESTVSNCNVEGCTIIGTTSVGGISGAAVATISGCTVKNTSITGSGVYIGGIQGDGGSTSSTWSQVPVTMTNCHVINATIRGTSYVGQLQGKNTTGLSVSDTFTNCDYDSQTTIQ